LGLVDRGLEHLRGELREVLVGARGEVAAAGHDLDDVDAALGVLAHRRLDAFLRRLGRPAQVMAVPARGRDRRSGGHDGWQPRLAAQAERQVVAVAEVPDGGDPAAQRRLGGFRHGYQRCVVVLAG
jgi:hypothetical protein